MKSISTNGFTALERQLLAKQVKIVSSKLHSGWQYVGESESAHLVLSKTQIVVSVDSTLVLVGDYPVLSTNSKVIESPVRLMQLTQLMAEHSDELHSNAMVLSDLFSTNRNVNLTTKVEGHALYLFPEQGKVSFDTENVAKLLELLSRHKLDKKQFSQCKKTNSGDLQSTKSKVLIWRLAKLEHDFANARIGNNQRCKIGVWPRVNVWEALPNPDQSKLALLFSRGFISPEKASKVTNIPLTKVKLFLHCCEANGITLHIQDADTREDNSEVIFKNETANENLGWLKKRIRKFVSHAS